MTGHEVLADKISERFDVPYKQVLRNLDSVTVKRLLQVLEEESGLLDRNAIETLEQREESAIKAERKARDAAFEAKRRERNADKKLAEIKELTEKADALIEQIGQLETPEARDRLRCLFAYNNLVRIETPQNNTAYISGCASILSGNFVSAGSGQPGKADADKKTDKQLGSELKDFKKAYVDEEDDWRDSAAKVHRVRV